MEQDNLARSWQLLRFLNSYRIVLALLFILSSSFGVFPIYGEGSAPQLFLACSLFYLLFSFISGFSIHIKKPVFSQQVYLQVILDILVLAVLMYAAGGVRSGLGMLLVVTVAGGSILTVGRTAIFFAAVATVVVLAAEFYWQLTTDFSVTNYAHTGMLGASFFTTAVLAHVLAKRLRETEAVAKQKSTDLLNMEAITGYIIQRMQTGILVVDKHAVIRFINRSVHNLLGEGQESQAPQKLSELSQELFDQFEAWRKNKNMEPEIIQVASTQAKALPRFARLGVGESTDTLIFLEDSAALTQQAQQIKLASLGRFTASIAHEVRNPLAAISHAGQLLAESPNMAPDDLRMTEIIATHSDRMNTMIENILQLSRREQTHTDNFLINPWLLDFIGELCESEGIETERISLNRDGEAIEVCMDKSQLQQILMNLCLNALRYTDKVRDVLLQINVAVNEQTGTPYLDVIDFGNGIEAEDVNQIFEPFFTTSKAGTGLGLYIARELCESNQARLSYLPASEGGSCFRIMFANPNRKQAT